jgi:hypothetical protein
MKKHDQEVVTMKPQGTGAPLRNLGFYALTLSKE